MSFLE